LQKERLNDSSNDLEALPLCARDRVQEKRATSAA
jgi:hypothetical protein